MTHGHMTIALISVVLFYARFSYCFATQKTLSNKALKIAPHIIDTLLLLSGAMLVYKLGYSLLELNWLSVKILLVIAYIGWAIAAFKATLKNRGLALAFASIATISLTGVVYLAINKPAF